MILHLFMKDKFIDAFVNFINANFEIKDHYFIIYGKDLIEGLRIESIGKRNVKYIEDIKEFLENNNENLLKHDKIIIHGLFHPVILDTWYSNLDLCAKTYVYLYGGDYYYKSNNDKEWIRFWKRKKEQALVETLKEKRRAIFKNVAGIINIIPEENDIVRKLYTVNCRMFYATYWEEKVVNHYRMTEKESDDILRVQVGNSAAKENDHKGIFKELYKYRNEKLKIYVPLSYGNVQYAQQVKKEGEKLFGSKFVAMEEYLNLEKYYEFQEGIDVAIFGMERQQALGNIQSHLFKGNTVYLRKTSVGAHFFENTIGCKIRYIENIKDIEFEEFSCFGEAEKIYNIEKMKEYYSIGKIIRQWQEIFEA